MNRRIANPAGFTLLELVVAFAILALFVLPVLEIVHQSRLRAGRTALKREVQDLAQKKLYERIYTYSQETIDAAALRTGIQPMEGNFAEEGRPNWEWNIPYPEIVSQGEQVLLQYTIQVFAPEIEANQIGGGSGAGGGILDGLLGAFGLGGSTGLPSSLNSSGRPASYEMTTWIFPSESWYLEQEQLLNLGINTGYYGDLYAR
ncbi:MAG: prepilin-type N-terminal cleavage/methylation domain-containing protein [Planctomycetes bacterium]|nr:prepilin-type N-terminal cleavage/methylation domain-containing protein [Planctomycetota bacterium]